MFSEQVSQQSFFQKVLEIKINNLKMTFRGFTVYIASIENWFGVQRKFRWQIFSAQINSEHHQKHSNFISRSWMKNDITRSITTILLHGWAKFIQCNLLCVLPTLFLILKKIKIESCCLGSVKLQFFFIFSLKKWY